MDVVRNGMDYKEYRNWFYENCIQMVICDSRETIPAALAIFCLAEGDPEMAAIYSANFGRDSDTIGTIAAAIAGALQGASAIREDWVKQIEAYNHTVQGISSSYFEYQAMQEIQVPDYRKLTNQFIHVIQGHSDEQKNIQNMLGRMMEK